MALKNSSGTAVQEAARREGGRTLAKCGAQPPDANERASVASAAYDHLKWIREHEDSIYAVYVNKVQRIVTVHVLLFAVMGYGLSQLEWLYTSATWVWLTTVALGVGAAVFLLMGFWSGMSCLAIGETSVVGVKKLKQTTEQRTLTTDFSLESFYLDQSTNLSTAIIAERERNNRRQQIHKRLNRSTGIALALVALFVGTPIIGNTIHALNGN